MGCRHRTTSQHLHTSLQMTGWRRQPEHNEVSRIDPNWRDWCPDEKEERRMELGDSVQEGRLGTDPSVSLSIPPFHPAGGTSNLQSREPAARVCVESLSVGVIARQAGGVLGDPQGL